VLAVVDVVLSEVDVVLRVVPPCAEVEELEREVDVEDVFVVCVTDPQL